MFSYCILIRLKQYFLAFIIACIPIFGMAQDNTENRAENLKSSFRVTVSTQLLMQRSLENPPNSPVFEGQDELFYQNPVFGINLDWYGWANVALHSRISYYSGSASHFEDRTGIVIGMPGLYEDNYHFNLLLLEPGVKVTLPFNNFEVFWNGGPTFGFGSVNLEVQITPVQYENGESEPRHEDTYKINQEKDRRDIGFYFSTGISLPISSSFRLQGEIGYRNLNLEEIEVSAGYFRFSTLNYQLDSFTPTLGITYIIR